MSRRPETGTLPVALCIVPDEVGPVGVSETEVEPSGIAATEAFGIDVLNGAEQRLDCELRGDATAFPRLLLKVYPIYLRVRTLHVESEENEWLVDVWLGNALS